MNNYFKLVLLGTIIIVAIGACQRKEQKLNVSQSSLIVDYVPDMVGRGVISKASFEGHASITPSGNEIYFAIYSNDHSYSTIAYSVKKAGKWQEPKIASFSGKYSDGSPALSPDGNTLFFSSKRPIEGNNINTSNDIWYVKRKNEHTKWEKPMRLGDKINTSFNEFSPSVDCLGNLYFCSNRPDGFGDMDVYYSNNKNGIYTQASVLDSTINSKYHEGNVGVSPNGKLLFVMIQNKPGGYGYDDIYYSVRKGQGWTAVKNIGGLINTYTYDFSPKVSPNEELLYFSSRINRDFTNSEIPYTYESFHHYLDNPLNGFGNIYKIKLSDLNLIETEF